MEKRRTTNILLLIIVIPIIFYLLNLLSFIFIPLALSMFITLLFLPLTRWLSKKGIPKVINIGIVILIMIGIVKILTVLIQLSSQEILSANGLFLDKAEVKISNLIYIIEDFFGINRIEGVSVFSYYSDKIKIFNNLSNSLEFVKSAISMTLMTIFFTVLLLAESINFQKLLNSTIFHKNYTSIKTFIKIEKDLITFIKVKFFVSFLTGIGIGLACYFFDVSFPIFWGLFAFAINFIQMVGSVISVAVTGLFSIVELDPTGTLLLFLLAITGVQVLFGGILEPIFMGKSFSINIITILIMLMFWGFIWGVPGMIMSIPITVFLKILFEQFPQTAIISELMSGNSRKINIRRK